MRLKGTFRLSRALREARRCAAFMSALMTGHGGVNVGGDLSKFLGNLQISKWGAEEAPDPSSFAHHQNPRALAI